METSVLNPEVSKKYKKMTTAQLLLKVGKLAGEDREAAIEILEQRGQDISRFKPSKGTFIAEPEEELTAEEQAMLDEAEENNGKINKVTNKKKIDEPKLKKEKVVSLKEEKFIKVKVNDSILELKVLKTFKNRGVVYFKVLLDGKNKDINEKNVIG